MPGIGVITNPKAKKNLKRPWIKDALQRIVGDTGKVYETRSIDELPDLAHEFIENGVEIIGVNGGDGTTHIAMSHFIPIYEKKNKPLPKLLTLRGGTMNTIANSIKHKGKGEDILSNVVEKYRAGKELNFIRQPILHVNDNYGFMWGYGVVGNFLEQYYKGTNLGPWQAVKTAVKLVGSAVFGTATAKQVFQPYESVLEIDGTTLEVPDCTAVMICSIVEVGLGAKIAYRAYEKPGYVHMRALTVKPYQFVPWLYHAFRGIRVPHEGFIDEIAKTITIKTKGNPPYTVDGELYKDTNEFVISQGPVMDVIREGKKKIRKHIGLPEGWDNPALPSESGINSPGERLGGSETERVITL